MKRVLFTLLFTSSLFAQDVTGKFAAGERYEAPADHAPATVSRMFVRTVTHDSPSVDLPATGGGMCLGGRARGARGTPPRGRFVRPGKGGSTGRGAGGFPDDEAGEVTP